MGTLGIAALSLHVFLKPSYSVVSADLDVKGQLRQYRLVTPVRPASGKRPLVIALHGALDTTDQMAQSSGLDSFAGNHDCVVIYPQGRMQNWPTPVSDRQHELVMADVHFLEAIRDLAVRDYNVDPQCIYLVGVSQGGAMCCLLTLYCNRWLAAAVNNCGWLPGYSADIKLQTEYKCPMLFIVGENDTQVGVAAVAQSCKAFQEAGHPVSWEVIPNHGHGWGGRFGINDRIWNFLSQQRR